MRCGPFSWMSFHAASSGPREVARVRPASGTCSSHGTAGADGVAATARRAWGSLVRERDSRAAIAGSVLESPVTDQALGRELLGERLQPLPGGSRRRVGGSARLQAVEDQPFQSWRRPPRASGADASRIASAEPRGESRPAPEQAGELARGWKGLGSDRRRLSRGEGPLRAGARGRPPRRRDDRLRRAPEPGVGLGPGPVGERPVPPVGNGTSRQVVGRAGDEPDGRGRHERVAESAAGQLAGDLEYETAELEHDGDRGRRIDAPAADRRRKRDGVARLGLVMDLEARAGRPPGADGPGRAGAANRPGVRTSARIVSAARTARAGPARSRCRRRRPGVAPWGMRSLDPDQWSLPSRRLRPAAPDQEHGQLRHETRPHRGYRWSPGRHGGGRGRRSSR